MPPWQWTHILTTATAAFLASLVEFIEALTVVLAVGAVRGWKGALSGAGLALLTLGALVAALGPALALIPLRLVQLAIGALLLLFGLRWLRKAVLRAAGLIPLHDEDAIYAKETALLKKLPAALSAFDMPAVAASFKIVMVEGIEVVFIVIAVGAGGTLLIPAAAGAGAALLTVIALGVLLHKPVAAIPENILKFAVGVLLAAFGSFWLLEGAGIVAPGRDWLLPILIGAYLAAALLAVRAARR